MDVEQRVQILEKEVELLKGEIQALLLDMQDYLLTQTHPELRGEARPQPTPPPSHPAPALAEMPLAANQPPTAPVRHVAARPISDTDPEGPDANSSPTLPGGAVFTQSTSPAKLQEWAMHKLKRHGSERTRELLNRYLVKGRLSAEQYEGAMQVVEQYGDAADKMLASRGVEAPAGPAPSVTSPKPRTAAKKPAHHNEQTNMVLRLIAGVHNAGIGISRKVNNG